MTHPFQEESLVNKLRFTLAQDKPNSCLEDLLDLEARPRKPSLVLFFPVTWKRVNDIVNCRG